MDAKTPAEMLRAYEEQWRPEVRRVSLIAELELAKQELTTALFCAGAVWKDAHFADRARTRIRSRYPAAFAVAVAGSASYHYEGRTAWKPILEIAEVPNDPNTSSAWGRTFIECLETLGLPTFPELDEERALRYVARMLLHGGLPLDHLDEWFEVADAGIRQLSMSDAAALHAWLTNRAEAGRLYGATTAVDRFLRFGGEYAVDFLDRSLDLLDRVRAGDGIDEIRVGLPRRYVERALELRERNELPGAPGRRTRTSGAVERPELRYDPYGLGVHVLLPGVHGSSGGVTWIIEIDGRSQRVAARSSRPDLPTSTAEVPVPSNIEEVHVALEGGSGSVAVRVVDPHDLLLLFDQDGRRIDRTSRLPRGVVWALRPHESNLTADEARVVEHSDLVARWPGWSATLYDLSTARWLQLDAGRRHAVEDRRGAHVDGVEPVRGVTTEEGLEVLSSWPQIVLPGSRGGATWTLTVNRSGDNTVLAEWTTKALEDQDLRIPLEDHADGWRGVPLEVRARGPLGRSLRRSVVVIPGLEIESSPPVRTFQTEGLSPTRVEIRGLDVPAFVLAPDERVRRVEIQGRVALLVEPPAVAVQHVRSGAGTTWRHTLMTLTLEDVLVDPGSLLVRLPGATMSPELIVWDVTGEELQRVPAGGRARADGAVLFDLARTTDTLRQAGAATLGVDSEIWTGGIASIRPADLAEWVDAQPDRGLIVLVGVPASGVEAALYTRLIPTRPPVVVSVDSGSSTIVVSNELMGLGPLRMMLRIPDPWAPSPWPAFPKAGTNVHDLEFPWDQQRLSAEHPLAPFLTNRAELPDVARCLGDALRVFSMAHVLNGPRSGSSIRCALGPRFSDDAAATLRAALDVGLDGPEMARALTDAGVVALWVDDGFTVEDIERLWHRWPAAGMLALAPRLTAGQPDDEFHRLLRDKAGNAVDALLSGDSCEAMAQPRFDIPQMIEWPEERLREIRAIGGIVPRLLLDTQSRAADGFAALAVIQGHYQGGLRACIGDAERVVRYTLDNVLIPFGAGVLSDAVRARITGDGWQLLPPLSLALAASARVGARLDESWQAFNGRSRATLTELVSAFPSLVGADLVMAEIALQGADR